MIKELIENIPNEDAVLALTDKFNKLIHKYANLVKTEDAYDELLVFFIELLHKIKLKKIGLENDGQIVNYINSSIRNETIRLKRESHFNSYILLDDLSKEQVFHLESRSSTQIGTALEEYFNNLLTPKEKYILFMIFEYGYSSSHIATIMGISRQAVNQAKKRAIQKIKQTMTD